MSGLKRMVTSRRRNTEAPAAPPPPEPQHKASSAAPRSLARRLTRAVTPHADPTQQQPQQNLDISAALASSKISVPSISTSTVSPGSPHVLPTPPPGVFRLGRLSTPQSVKLLTLLEKSPRGVTVKKADAERTSLVITVKNERDIPALLHVLERYLPYALTCWDIAERLKSKGTYVSSGVTWTSGLTDPNAPAHKYQAGLAMEAAMVLMLFAVTRVRKVIETEAGFAAYEDERLVTNIKSLQVAAGVFAYVRDTVAPAALADFSGTPPPEIFPDTAAMFFYLSLSLAQALHVRRAVLNGMSSTLLGKLSAAAADYAQEALAKFDSAGASNVRLCPTIKTAAADILLLCQGWVHEYHGATLPSEEAGAKVSALHAAIQDRTVASGSAMVGKIAASGLDDLRQALADSEADNRTCYQQSIPDRIALVLPPGRSLVNPATFEAPRVPRADIPSQRAKT